MLAAQHTFPSSGLPCEAVRLYHCHAGSATLSHLQQDPALLRRRRQSLLRKKHRLGKICYMLGCSYSTSAMCSCSFCLCTYAASAPARLQISWLELAWAHSCFRETSEHAASGTLCVILENSVNCVSICKLQSATVWLCRQIHGGASKHITDDEKQTRQTELNKDAIPAIYQVILHTGVKRCEQQQRHIAHAV